MTETLVNETDKNITGHNRWKVEIDSFEGPLDLLLHLIKEKNVDIYDIPIAQITEEYLKYLEVIKQLNLDNVGDFLIMASVLMRIKSRTLLPQQIVEEGEEDAEELRQNLIQRLLEYKRYKESSNFFREKERQFEGVYPLHQYPVKEFGETVEVTLFDLIDAFQNLVKNAKKEIKDIITEEITVEEKVRLILDRVEKHERVELKQIIEKADSIMDLIVTLLAILELVRTHQIRVLQQIRFGTIFIQTYGQQPA